MYYFCNQLRYSLHIETLFKHVNKKNSLFLTGVSCFRYDFRARIGSQFVSLPTNKMYLVIYYLKKMGG